MISAGQRNALMGRAAQQIEDVYATTITVDGAQGRTIPAARWAAGKAADGVDGGLLTTADVVFRVRVSEVPAGVVWVPDKTVIVEGGVRYRLTRVRRGTGDPAVSLECMAE